jgi:hypothetical protein
MRKSFVYSVLCLNALLLTGRLRLLTIWLQWKWLEVWWWLRWEAAARDAKIRFVQDDCTNMTNEEWGVWLNSLTWSEFITLMALGYDDENEDEDDLVCADDDCEGDDPCGSEGDAGGENEDRTQRATESLEHEDIGNGGGAAGHG